jgi:hypothetical protein
VDSESLDEIRYGLHVKFVLNLTNRFESGRPMPNLTEMLQVIHLDLRTDVLTFPIMCLFF